LVHMTQIFCFVYTGLSYYYLHSQSWLLQVGSDVGWSMYECGLRIGEELVSDCWFSVMIYLYAR
jgi:hypothetical protein